MEWFQKIILYSAIIILIITLVLIGLSLKYSNKNYVWPPMIPECPDYWVMDGSGNNSKCVNIQDLGTCPAQNGNTHLIMDFGTAPFVGAHATCSKYNWANKCGISWDGITYGAKNPC